MFYDQRLIARASTKSQWQDKDNPEEYRLPNLYSQSDIEYSYNKWGFRCDDFDLSSELPILFTGCSFTEGTGLPIDQIWSYRLVEKIRNHTGKNIPYWSLSQNAAGLDAIAGALYWFKRKFNHSIKYIVCLWPGFSRREFSFKNAMIQYWMGSNQHYTPDAKVVDPVFADEHFAKYQSIRSLMLIDSQREIYGAKLIFSMWSIDSNPSNDQNLVKETFPDFVNIEYPNPELYNINLARDNSHPGPNQHREICNSFWNNYFSRELI